MAICVEIGLAGNCSMGMGTILLQADNYLKAEGDGRTGTCRTSCDERMLGVSGTWSLDAIVLITFILRAGVIIESVFARLNSLGSVELHIHC